MVNSHARPCAFLSAVLNYCLGISKVSTVASSEWVTTAMRLEIERREAKRLQWREKERDLPWIPRRSSSSWTRPIDRFLFQMQIQGTRAPKEDIFASQGCNRAAQPLWQQLLVIRSEHTLQSVSWMLKRTMWDRGHIAQTRRREIRCWNQHCLVETEKETTGQPHVRPSSWFQDAGMPGLSIEMYSWTVLYGISWRNRMQREE